jgi:hypothetical protein
MFNGYGNACAYPDRTCAVLYAKKGCRHYFADSLFPGNHCLGAQNLLQQALLAQEWLNCGFLSAEPHIGIHAFVQGIVGQDVFPEFFGKFLVEQVAGLLEGVESIGIQDAGPAVNVVPCSITGAENMAKVGGAVPGMISLISPMRSRLAFSKAFTSISSP